MTRRRGDFSPCPRVTPSPCRYSLFWSPDILIPCLRTPLALWRVRLRPGKGSLVLDAAKERLDSAQAFDKSMLENREFVEEIYKHFGVSPYWAEAVPEMAFRGMQDFPMEAPSTEQYMWP